MADICLIYASPSRSIVQKLHAILSEQYSVWWDQDIGAGNYRTEIEKQLKQAKCVVPVWCNASRDNENVLDEANYAKSHQVPLLPVRIAGIPFPMGFGSLHTIDLFDWKGDPSDPRIRELFKAIKGAALARPQGLNIGDNRLRMPVFFRSVSSHETALRPAAAVQALTLFPPDALLVSAYDMLNEPEEQRVQMNADLASCRAAGSLVLIDSGNYEAYRKSDRNWNFQQLHQALAVVPHDLAFCFDDTDPPRNMTIDELVRGVVESVERETKHTSAPVLPIVHAPRDAQGDFIFKAIPEAIRRVCQELHPIAVAIPERELGDGILARARTVYAIRESLKRLGFYQPIHILGTGNPLSIAILSATGADWFDGLEWCRTAVDSETGRLFHLQQYDFFAWQSEVAASPIVKEAVSSEKIAFAGKVIFHNLEFFSTWMEKLRKDLNNGKIDLFLTEKLPLGRDSMKILEEAVPEVFQ
jgi:queuine/archaeosine tRNA-ribosyltransferase